MKSKELKRLQRKTQETSLRKTRGDSDRGHTHILDTDDSGYGDIRDPAACFWNLPPNPEEKNMYAWNRPHCIRSLRYSFSSPLVASLVTSWDISSQSALVAADEGSNQQASRKALIQ